MTSTTPQGDPDTLQPPGDFERPGGLLSRVDGHLVMYHDPHSVHAEQYRACRTNLTALNRPGAPWAIALTSSKHGEGKSITAGNLAACMAELPGTRVCLVDTDSRATSQAGIFGIETNLGVTELLLGEAAMKDVIVPTIVPQLDFIGAGREAENPAELLGSNRFASLVDELKRRYSWIILDTPPVHPFTDACVVSAQVNGALVVVRLQETPREIVNRTIDSIAAAGGKVLGTFLTGQSPDKDDGRYYYYNAEGTEAGEVDGLERGKAKRQTEKRLRSQELAYLKRQRRLARDEEDDVV